MSSFMEPLARASAQGIFSDARRAAKSGPARSGTRGAGSETAMEPEIDASGEGSVLEKAGLAAGEARAWLAALPELRDDFGADSWACSQLWGLGGRLRAQLPRRTARNAAQAAAGALLHGKER